MKLDELSGSGGRIESVFKVTASNPPVDLLDLVLTRVASSRIPLVVNFSRVQARNLDIIVGLCIFLSDSGGGRRKVAI